MGPGNACGNAANEGGTMVKGPVRIKRLPAKAVNIQYFLDIILQVLQIVSNILSIFNIQL